MFFKIRELSSDAINDRDILELCSEVYHLIPNKDSDLKKLLSLETKGYKDSEVPDYRKMELFCKVSYVKPGKFNKHFQTYGVDKVIPTMKSLGVQSIKAPLSEVFYAKKVEKNYFIMRNVDFIKVDDNEPTYVYIKAHHRRNIDLFIRSAIMKEVDLIIADQDEKIAKMDPFILKQIILNLPKGKEHEDHRRDLISAIEAMEDDESKKRIVANKLSTHLVEVARDTTSGVLSSAIYNMGHYVLKIFM